MSFRERYQKETVLYRMPVYILPALPPRVQRIVVDSGKRIAKYCKRLFKGDAMLPAIRIRLCSVPREAESHPNSEYHPNCEN